MGGLTWVKTNSAQEIHKWMVIAVCCCSLHSQTIVLEWGEQQSDENKYEEYSLSLWADCSNSRHLWNSLFCTVLDIIAQCGLSLRFGNNTAKVLNIFLSRYHINQHFISSDSKAITIILVPWELQDKVLSFDIERVI